MEFLHLERDNCVRCSGGGMTEYIEKSFTYSMTVLEPFVVRNAKLWRCNACGRICLSKSETRKWEKDKALEISISSGCLSGTEAKFLRQALNISPLELAIRMGVTEIAVKTWETCVVPAGLSQILKMLVIQELGGEVILNYCLIFLSA